MPQRSVLGSALRRIVSTPNENDLLQRWHRITVAIDASFGRRR